MMKFIGMVVLAFIGLATTHPQDTILSADVIEFPELNAWLLSRNHGSGTRLT